MGRFALQSFSLTFFSSTGKSAVQMMTTITTGTTPKSIIKTTHFTGEPFLDEILCKTPASPFKLLFPEYFVSVYPSTQLFWTLGNFVAFFAPVLTNCKHTSLWQKMMWEIYCSAGKQQDQLEEKRERTAQQGGGGGQRLQAPVTDMKAPPLRFKFSSCQFLNLCQICWGACSSQLYPFDRLKSLFEKSGPALSVLTRVVSWGEWIGSGLRSRQTMKRFFHKLHSLSHFHHIYVFADN